MQHISDILKNLTPQKTSPRPSASTPAAPRNQPVCSKCDDLGWVSVQRLDGLGTRLVECDCKLPEHMARLQAICGLTSAELSASLADIDARSGTDTARMIDAAQRFIDYPVGMLTIYGSCGNAKTVALQAIANASIARNRGAIYTTFYDLVSNNICMIWLLRLSFRPRAPRAGNSGKTCSPASALN